MLYNTSKELVVALGDVHGSWGVIKRFCEDHPNTCVIQVGDFGVGFNHPEKDSSQVRKLARVVRDNDCELYIIRGNHDNPLWFQHDEVVEDVLHFCSDYSVLTLPTGRTVQLVGGAISIDRSDRIAGQSYWTREGLMFDPTRIQEVDVLITHTSPTRAGMEAAALNPVVQHYHSIEFREGEDLLAELAKEQGECQLLSDASKCRQHFFGHHHVSHYSLDPIASRSYRCLNIDEFFQL